MLEASAIDASGIDLRLATHGERRASRQVLVDRPNLFRNVCECFVEEFEALFLDFLKIVLGFLGRSSRIFKIPLGCLQAAFDTLESFYRSHVRCHLFQLILERGDLPL